MPAKKISTNSKNSLNGLTSKKSDSKKVVVKRRTSELVPTKASAAAIASRAKRVKNQSFSSKKVSNTKVSGSVNKSTKIPLGVWIFFGCALLLFSVAFYKAIINPQLDVVVIDNKEGKEDKDMKNNINVDLQGDALSIDLQKEENNDGQNDISASDYIVLFFDVLSNQDFAGVFNMLDGPLQKSSEMKDHFTSFRMSPFLAGIQGEKLHPTNINYVGKTAAGNDEYHFDLSYILKSSGVQYDEQWKVIIKNVNGNSKIASLVCETKRCSYHPLFWPENYDLMR